MAPDPQRLDPATFQLPVGRLRAGYYTDAYFNSTKELLEAQGRHPRVLMQVFQKQESLLGGIDEAIAVLKVGAGHVGPDGIWVPAWDDLVVHALHEGDAITPRETVLTIEGDYAQFAHLETVYLGCMARRSLVMRNVRAVVDAAGGKEILFFPARHDHWLVQTGDGWAAHVADALGDALWGVRLDTSETLVDRALTDLGDAAPHGVSVELARRVRTALDDAGHQRVKIVASGGFDADKIRHFETEDAPVDAYGVGSSLLRGQNDFTADIVEADDKLVAKVGRQARPNPYLVRVP